ncbi:hypothetical protein NIASO_02855 [Niabella soli DSM 19437]|uniref:Uncharacterized protein n=1 Tax=Niabella soli DSM 19437 TaxID=929713 RepID=W0F5U0_9BACT|nr:hypothetical protein NIASO_02855 [Niabella soli DSM 19437]
MVSVLKLPTWVSMIGLLVTTCLSKNAECIFRLCWRHSAYVKLCYKHNVPDGARVPVLKLPTWVSMIGLLVTTCLSKNTERIFRLCRRHSAYVKLCYKHNVPDGARVSVLKLETLVSMIGLLVTTCLSKNAECIFRLCRRHSAYAKLCYKHNVPDGARVPVLKLPTWVSMIGLLVTTCLSKNDERIFWLCWRHSAYVKLCYKHDVPDGAMVSALKLLAL